MVITKKCIEELGATVMGRTIIVYYSWTGTTDLVAREIQSLTSFPIERIIELKKDKRSMMNAAMGAFFGMRSRIYPFIKDPGSYDNIILGTPVWATKIPPAILAFLHKIKLKNKKVWVFMSKSIDEEPISAMNLLKKKIENKGGKFIDVLYTKSFWSPEKQELPKVEDIKGSITDWLDTHHFLV